MNKETTRSSATKCNSFSSSAQLILFFITQTLGVAIVIMIFCWAGTYRGFDWNGHGKYSWHPTIMIVGTIYLTGTALCCFRLMPYERHTIKLIHQIVNSLVLISMAFAFYVIVDLKNSANKGHFTTLHSWVGLITMILIVSQLPISLIVYGFQWSTAQLRTTLMPWHKKCGIVILLLAIATNLTGLQSHIRTKIYAEKMLLNVIGLLILIFTFLILMIITGKKYNFNKILVK